MAVQPPPPPVEIRQPVQGYAEGVSVRLRDVFAQKAFGQEQTHHSAADIIRAREEANAAILGADRMNKLQNPMPPSPTGQTTAPATNAMEFATLGDKMTKAATFVDGEVVQYGNSMSRAEIFSYAFLDMAGLKDITLPSARGVDGHPSAVQMRPSPTVPGAMIMNLKGLSDAEVKTLASSINQMMGSEGATVLDKPVLYGHSIQLPMSFMDGMIPQVQAHLDGFYNVEFDKQAETTKMVIDKKPPPELDVQIVAAAAAPKP